MTTNLHYDPLMNTDNEYYQTFYGPFVSDVILVVRYLLGEDNPVLAL